MLQAAVVFFTADLVAGRWQKLACGGRLGPVWTSAMSPSIWRQQPAFGSSREGSEDLDLLTRWGEGSPALLRAAGPPPTLPKPPSEGRKGRATRLSERGGASGGTTISGGLNAGRRATRVMPSYTRGRGFRSHRGPLYHRLRPKSARGRGCSP
ncbi:hypothetical protein NDU88_011745 [Pleurodeles waltl]|uniref:Uncharacterized protein n=1 Tax=Pleurodeles waltl TaxID=8319 RepID=A0AAV7PZR5_PLEWA|nr:hypothetical protein NDU88_011745 [Pleurodeles waltl]